MTSMGSTDGENVWGDEVGADEDVHAPVRSRQAAAIPATVRIEVIINPDKPR